jgi:hypothetical protein
LTKDKYPVAFENKVQELMEECKLTREEAEESVSKMEIELEIYYEKGYGLFAVESGAVDSGTIYSPYSGELSEAPEY